VSWPEVAFYILFVSQLVLGVALLLDRRKK